MKGSEIIYGIHNAAFRRKVAMNRSGQQKQRVDIRLRCKMYIEGDGATDQYGLRITEADRSFVVQGLSREEMNYHLKDLVDQFLSLSSQFDEMSRDSEVNHADV